jgi:hypothetical protein
MHSFCHIEIPATNAKKASEFYSSLFGWPMNKMEGMEYYLFGEQDGKVYGGISGVEKFTSDPTVCNYVEVESIPVILKKAETLGAKMVRPKTEIPGGMGFFAIFQDPQGYHLGVWAKS